MWLKHYSNIMKTLVLVIVQQEELNNLQGQVSARYESRLVLDNLKKDREDTYKEYTEVRLQLTTDAALDDKQLLTLTTESNNVIKVCLNHNLIL